MGFLQDFRDLYTEGDSDPQAYDLEDAPNDALPREALSWETLDGDNAELAPEQPRTEKPDDADNPV